MVKEGFMINGKVNILGWEIFAFIKLSEHVSIPLQAFFCVPMYSIVTFKYASHLLELYHNIVTAGCSLVVEFRYILTFVSPTTLAVVWSFFDNCFRSRSRFFNE